MNYLAHLFLAKSGSHSVTGNLMGDFLKGVKIDLLPPEIKLGIQNHMLVDRFTDNHHEVLGLKKVISQDRKRYAGIITDVIFDYFLIKHWNRYSRLDFDRFVDNVYDDLTQSFEIMPSKMKMIVTRMVNMDWFRSYASLETMGYVLDRVSQRIRFENRLSGAIDEVERHYHIFDECFLSFFHSLSSMLKRTISRVWIEWLY